MNSSAGSEKPEYGKPAERIPASFHCKVAEGRHLRNANLVPEITANPTTTQKTRSRLIAIGSIVNPHPLNGLPL